MLTESIQNKINELFQDTPDNVGVAYGNKVIGGQQTNERSIVFMVEKKLPINEIPSEEVLPTTINIDGVEYKTDVIEVGKIEVFSCDGTTLGTCYGWQNPSTPPSNRNTIRPLQGGVSITSTSKQGTVGTMGFIAVDVETQAIVGVTNNHVVIGDAFYTSQRNLNSTIENELNDLAYQTGDYQPSPSNLQVGQVVRYVPIYRIGSPNQYDNYVDGALISLTSTTINNTVSFKQYGLTGNIPMPFASTSEINNLLSSNPPLYSTGRTTGPKEGSPCGLKINAVGVASAVSGYHSQGSTYSAYYGDLLCFTRINPDCSWPIYPGDSGSGLIANFSGTWKIIGLCFAGSQYFGYAARIDRVANMLGIEAWDGTAKNYIDPTTIQNITIPGGTSTKTTICNAKTYWQVGLTNTSNPC
jgi:hypothetical protein